jgi:hypothetical protein
LRIYLDLSSRFHRRSNENVVFLNFLYRHQEP